MHRIGIDEVGRGPLAGPVTVAAVALRKDARLPKALGPLRDSKQLTRSAREAWAAWVAVSLPHAIRHASARRVDRVNVSAAANECALACWEDVCARIEGERSVRLDGGLYLGSRLRQLAECPDALSCPKSDENYREVALASILAKVTRDRMMADYALRHPGYGFERHVGYATKAHFAALRELGPSPIHRLTFLRTLGTMHPIP